MKTYDSADHFQLLLLLDSNVAQKQNPALSKDSEKGGAQKEQEIAFRPLCRADVFPLFDATRNPAFNQHLLWDAPSNVEGAMIQVEKLLRSHRTRQAVAISAVEKITGKWCGLSVLKPYRDGHEISLYIHPNYWGKDIALTIGRGVIQMAFDANPEKPMYNRIRPENVAMLSIVKGYRFVKIDEEALTHERGHSVPLHVYRVTHAEWPTFEDQLENY